MLKGGSWIPQEKRSNQTSYLKTTSVGDAKYDYLQLKSMLSQSQTSLDFLCEGISRGWIAPFNIPVGPPQSLLHYLSIPDLPNKTAISNQSWLKTQTQISV